MSKPTMQDIANALSTSRITVWKALNNKDGVSEQLREKIHLTAEDMGYVHSSMVKQKVISADLQTPKTIAAVVSRPESSAFWMEIIHHIAKELARKGVNLMYTYLPTYHKKDYKLPSLLTDGSVSGIIVLNVYSEKLLEMISAIDLPKVFLDTVPNLKPKNLNGDLVIIEGRSLVREITGRLLDMGYTRLSFVGDINYAQTNMDRYDGFIDAFKKRGLDYNENYNKTNHLGLLTHYKEISQFLDTLSPFPQGFVCASDYIAHFIDLYCEERKINRDNIIITGFDNSTEYGNVAGIITTVDVQTKMLGSRLANKIIFAIEHANAMQEVSYILSKIIYRGKLKEL